jgi:hypothetical protein
MDPITVATAVVGFLSPLVAKGLEEVATSALGDIYASIKAKISKDPAGEKAIEKFEKDPQQGLSEFQSALLEHLKKDHELMLQLTEFVQKSQTSSPLVNKVEAKNVVIAEKIDRLTMD